MSFFRININISVRETSAWGPMGNKMIAFQLMDHDCTRISVSQVEPHNANMRQFPRSVEKIFFFNMARAETYLCILKKAS